MTESDDLRAVATELLRLYDWRFELGKMQAEIETAIKQDDEAARTGHLRWREGTQRRNVERLLNQYGREKKAAWEKLRALLARPVDEPQVRMRCKWHGDRCADFPSEGHVSAETFIVPSASSRSSRSVDGEDAAQPTVEELSRSTDPEGLATK